MARGVDCILIDEDGNEYIDFIAGIAVGSIGHCHPHYVEALKRQVERLTFGSFTTEPRAKFLDLLASVTPEGLNRIQLFSGGAEAVEAALRLAQAATGKSEVVGFWGGFHGKTAGVMPLLGSDFKHHLGPFTPGRYLSPYADCYRCPLKLRYPDCGIACAEFLRDVIRYQTGGDIGAIIVEPMQGTAGNVIPPEGFLRALQSIAREHGARSDPAGAAGPDGRAGALSGVSASRACLCELFALGPHQRPAHDQRGHRPGRAGDPRRGAGRDRSGARPRVGCSAAPSSASATSPSTATCRAGAGDAMSRSSPPPTRARSSGRS